LLSKKPEEPLLVLPGPAGLLLAALLLEASSSSPYIHQNGQHLQQVTLARYLHAAGSTTAKASSSSPYIHGNGQHLQQVTLARYLHAAGCTTAGRFILIALHT